MGRIVRVRLTGPEAELGLIAASDVARLLLGTERLVRFSASSILGKPLTGGRWGKLIEQVGGFRLLGIEPGSVEGVLELPDLEAQDDAFELEVSHLGEEALDLAMRTAAGELDDRLAAAALFRLADELSIGTRLESLHFDVEGAGRAPVVIDAAVRDRLQMIALSKPDLRPDTVVGTLVEADFERGTARLRTVDGRVVKVGFEKQLADDIQEALRRTAELVGEVSYDPETEVAMSVRLRRISHAEQLALSMETGDFWFDVGFEQQLQEQGIGPAEDLALLGDPELSEEEADAFLGALRDEA